MLRLQRLWVLLFLTASSTKARTNIEWMGYNWTLGDSGSEKVGPGPNYFSPSNVEVTQDGKLRLYIRATDKVSSFACAKAGGDSALGYGTYAWDMSTSVESVVDRDPNVVLGLFLYKSDTEEIDIEWTRSGNDAEDANNMNYVVQPFKKDVSGYKFRLPTGHSHTRHQFTYTPSVVVFKVTDLDENTVIHMWSTTKNIPTPEDLPPIINLWMKKGQDPINKVTSVDIDSFHFEPYSPSSAPSDEPSQSSPSGSTDKRLNSVVAITFVFIAFLATTL